jgi:hypothetical protein
VLIVAKRVLASKVLFATLLACALVVALSAGFSRPGTVRAAGCGAEPTQPSDLYEVVSPPTSNFMATAAAPVDVTVHIKGGVLQYPAGNMSTVLDWGDGSASIPIGSSPCDAETAAWSDQTYSHTFATAGFYKVILQINFINLPSIPNLPNPSGAFPVVFITVTAAAPTPAPTPVPTTAPSAEPTQAPTSAPPAAPTAATAAPNQPAATLPSAAGSTGTVEPSPSPSPSLSPSPSPSATPSPTATQPSATASPVAAIAAIASPPPPPPPTQGIQMIESLKAPDEISTDPGVVATNIVLAGVTVWVLFSSVMLNQVLQSNRAELDQKTARLLTPARRASRAIGSWFQNAAGTSRLGSMASAATVLALTGVIYSVLDPGFGWNRATLTLFVSVALGIGVVTYAYSGLEAAMTRRLAGAAAAVRPYPAAIGIAVVSVVISRVLDFRPGVMYGFIASCAILTPVEADRRTEGRIAASPTTVILVLSVVAWLLVQPLRSWYGSSGSWLAEVLEAAAVVIFVGGIESLFISMIPIAGMDGAKIFRWSRLAWIAFAVLSAFLAWHVLLGRDQAYFSGLRKAQDATVLALFVVYTTLTLGIWAYFRFRRPSEAARREPAAIEADGSPAPGG